MLLLCNNYAFVFDYFFARALVVCVVYTFNKITPSPIKTGVERFLASMNWNCCGSYRRECVAHWTKLLAMRSFIPNPSFRTSFRSLITCRAAQIHTSYSVAPMLVMTNSLIGTVHRKQDFGYITKEEKKKPFDIHHKSTSFLQS